MMAKVSPYDDGSVFTGGNENTSYQLFKEELVMDYTCKTSHMKM